MGAFVLVCMVNKSFLFSSLFPATPGLEGHVMIDVVLLLWRPLQCDSVKGNDLLPSPLCGNTWQAPLPQFKLIYAFAQAD